MKHRNKKPTSNQKTSLSSKLREFWILHPNILILVVCAIFVTAAIITLCAVGAYRHWELKKLFTSPNAILIYVVSGLIAGIYIFQRLIFKRW